MIYEDCKLHSYEEIWKSNCYKTLSKDKPECLNEAEWKEVLEDLAENLESDIGNRISKISVKADDLIKILKLDKPQNLNEDMWRGIRGKVINKMEILLQDSTTYIYDVEVKEFEVYKTLNKKKPEYLSNDEWEEFKETN